MKALNTLVLLVARAEFAAEQLQIAVDRGASRRVIEALVDQRAEALEALSEHHSPTRDDLYMPPVDRHRPHQRRARPTQPDSDVA